MASKHTLSVLDYFATAFAGFFYRQLAEKEPLHRAFRAAIDHIRQEEARLRPDAAPGQWMIPQLYCSQRCEQLVDWEKPFTPLEFSNLKFITGQNRLLLERHEGYQFLGRRRERRLALPPLLDKQPVLLRGQGGVGKTAMAEHLVQRLMLHDGRAYPFVFNETSTSITGVLDALKNYLRTEHKRFLIDSQVEKASEKAMEQFLFLLALLDEPQRLCLGLLAQYRRPVLPMAVEVQEELPNLEQHLERLVALTLLERRREPLDKEAELVYYYVSPIVRSLLEQMEAALPAFSHYGQALEYLERSLKIRQEIGDVATRLTLDSLVHRTQGPPTVSVHRTQPQPILSNFRRIPGDVNGMATTMLNIGAIYCEREEWEVAVAPIFQAYRIFEQIGSPNAKTSEGYLSALIQKIGEQRFKEILEQLNTQND